MFKNKEHEPSHPIETGPTSYCDQLIIALLLVIIIAVPLFFGVHLYSVFDLSKITILYILTFTILSIWSIKTIIICWTSPTQVTSGWKPARLRHSGGDAGRGTREEVESSTGYRPSSFRHSWWSGLLGNTHSPYLLAQPLNLPIIAFLFVSGLATFFSINPYISLAGTYKRYDGLISSFVYVFLFYAVVNFIQRRRLGLLLNVIILTTCIASIYGVFQHFGMDLYQWNTTFGFGIRVCSTFGHPAFFSAFLTMVIPLVLIKIFSPTETPCPTTSFRRGSLKLKARSSKPFCFQLSAFGFPLAGGGREGFKTYLFIGILALLLITFYYTKTRASFLGLIASNLFFFFLIGRKALLANKAKTIVTLTVLVGISLFYNINDKTSVTGRFVQDMKPTLPKGTTALEREGGFADQLEGTTRERIFQYITGLKIIHDYPILGIGPDTLGFIYPQYHAKVYNEKGERRNFENQNRIHNDFLDVTASRGLLGLGVYLWFIFAYSRMVWKGYKKSDGGGSAEGTTEGLSATANLPTRLPKTVGQEARDKILIIGICSGCLSYFIQNQFSFGHIPIITLFWFLIGMSVIACNHNLPPHLAVLPVLSCESKNRDEARKRGGVGGQILTKWFNNPALERLVKTAACGLIVCFMILLITISLFFYKADIYFGKGRKFLNKNSMIKAVGNYEMAVKYNPLEMNYRNVLNDVYLKMAATSLNKNSNNIPPTASFRSSSEQAVGEYMPGLSTQEQTTMWLTNTIIGAEEVQRLYPKDYRSAFTLGQAYHLLDGISNKDMSKYAIKYYKRAITLHPFMFTLRDKLAQIYVEKGHYQEAVHELKEATCIEPYNPVPYINLTNVFIKLGRYEDARKLCNRILELKGSANSKYNEYAKNKLELLSKLQATDDPSERPGSQAGTTNNSGAPVRTERPGGREKSDSARKW
jgi:tetratricopeptide (TPR) repeat protein